MRLLIFCVLLLTSEVIHCQSGDGGGDIDGDYIIVEGVEEDYVELGSGSGDDFCELGDDLTMRLLNCHLTHNCYQRKVEMDQQMG